MAIAPPDPSRRAPQPAARPNAEHPHPLALPEPSHYVRTDDAHEHSSLLKRLDDPPGRAERLTARDPFPLPATKARVGYYGPRHLDYWVSGLDDYHAIRAAIARHARTDDRTRLQPGDAVLDMGCSSGRVLRHLSAQFPHDGRVTEADAKAGSADDANHTEDRPREDLTGRDAGEGEAGDQTSSLICWGVDIKPEPIDWVRANLSPDLRVLRGGSEPPFPIEDGSLALVCAFSVFTHIDEAELAWIAEVRRVLRPGGIAYLSVHTERTWKFMGENPHWPLHGFLTRDGADDLGNPITAEDLLGPMPRERINHVAESSPVPRVFQSQDYLRREWGRFLEVLEIVERGAIYQDVVVLRKV